jgi:hypothetical protein
LQRDASAADSGNVVHVFQPMIKFDTARVSVERGAICRDELGHIRNLLVTEGETAKVGSFSYCVAFLDFLKDVMPPPG